MKTLPRQMMRKRMPEILIGEKDPQYGAYRSYGVKHDGVAPVHIPVRQCMCYQQHQQYQKHEQPSLPPCFEKSIVVVKQADTQPADKRYFTEQVACHTRQQQEKCYKPVQRFHTMQR